MAAPATAPQLPRKKDWFSALHFCVWLVLGITLDASDELDMLFDLSLLVGPLIFLFALIAAITFIAGLIVNPLRRRWWRLVSVIAAPVFTASLLVILSHAGWDADGIRFRLMRSHYEAQLRNQPWPSSACCVWYWGDSGGLATNPDVYFFLVYDKMDKPLDQYQRHLHDPENADKRSQILKSFGDHFFLVTDTDY